VAYGSYQSAAFAVPDLPVPGLEAIQIGS